MVLLAVAAMAGCGAATPEAITATATAAPVGLGVNATTEAPQAAAAARATGAVVTHAAGTAQAQGAFTATAVQATASMAMQLATGTAGAATRVARATSTAQPLGAAVERLVSEGYLSQGQGRYESLLDFYREWAQINWYQWYDTGKAPTDFVVQAHVAWESASDTANWFNSGCGFVFREAPRDADNQALNHYLAYLGLDGVAYLVRQRNSEYLELGHAKYGRVDVPAGEATIMLAVEGESISFFVNDEHVITRQDGALASGGLSYTLLSGTNRDFGTRCEMTEVGLWWLEP